MQTPWIVVWQIVLSLGFGAFFLLVLVVIPLGARDVRRLFRRLDEEKEIAPIDGD